MCGLGLFLFSGVGRLTGRCRAGLWLLGWCLGHNIWGVLTDFEPKSIFIRFYFNNGLYKEEGEKDQIIALIEINEIKSIFNY